MILLVLYFLSGAAALVFESVFLRQATWLVGSAVTATSLVLAAFMAGLAAGSAGGGPLADRSARPLRLYGLLEIGTGLSGAALAWLLGSGREALLSPLLRASGAARPFSEAVLAFALLAVPAALMGASLPAVARFAIESPERVLGSLGRLYGANTLGAAAGALAAGFALFEAVGISGSAFLAAGIDLAVGAAAIALDRPAPSGSGAAAPRFAPSSPASAARPVGGRARAACLAAAGIGGAAVLGYEVVWTRLLTLPMRSYAYSFSLMLSLFLLGLVLGAAAAAAIGPRLRDLPQALAAVQVAMGLYVAASTLWLPALLAPTEAGGFAPFVALSSLKAAAVVLPPTILSGMALPLAAAAVARGRGRIGRGIGSVFAVNTAGAIAGALGAGLLLLPALGAPASLAVLAALHAASGALVAALAVPSLPRRLLAAALAAACLLPAIVSHAGYVRRFVAAGRGRESVREVLAFHEGATDTIAVVRKDYGFFDPEAKSLLTNGVAMSATVLPVRRYMALEGHLPVLLAPGLARVAVVCVGTGITLGAVASHPDVRAIDAVELSEGVVRALPQFAAESGEPWKDPRVRLVREDGRHFLEASRDRYDAITLEPPPPIVAGAVHLYSLDFYRVCRRRLAPGGVVAQWLPLHAQSLESARMVARTFLDAFPHAELWLPSIRDAVLLGSDRPLRLDPGRLRAAFSDPRTAASLRGAMVETPEALLATRLLDREAIERWAAGAPPITDDRPRMEFFRAHGGTMRDPEIGTLLAAAAGVPPGPAGLEADPSLAARAAAEREAFRLYLESEVRDDPRAGIEAARRSRGTEFFLYRFGCAARQREFARRGLASHPEWGEALRRCEAWFGPETGRGAPPGGRAEWP